MSKPRPQNNGDRLGATVDSRDSFPRRMARPRFWLSTLSLLAVLGLIYLDLGQTSPGPISLTHAQASVLSNGQACAECHGGLGISMQEACADCHGEILLAITQGTGVHGNLAEEAVSRSQVAATECGTCHGEHHGEEFEIAGPLSFRLAGLGEPEDFDHAALEFGLLGAHDQLECSDCHAKADAKLLLEGQQRFLGASNACATCHDNPHEEAGLRSCQECHGQDLAFEQLDGFTHTKAFPLTGPHGATDLECSACHEGEGDFRLSRIDTHDFAPAARECASCHESPHSAQSMAPFQGTAGASCSTCHAPSDTSFRIDSLVTPGLLALHDAVDFPLGPPHVQTACIECHQGDSGLQDGPLAFQAKFPGRVLADCAACHEDPHGRAFTKQAGVDSCVDCHGTSSESSPQLHATFAQASSAMDRALHEATGFALSTPHGEATCAECHSGLGFGQRFLTGQEARLPGECASCHASPHGGQFENSRIAEDSSACTACHFPESFAPSKVDVALHNQSRFHLDGAHASVACTECHADPAAGEQQSFVGVSTKCADCHVDVHEGRIDMGARSGDCSECHSTLDFHEVESVSLGTFDHESWCGFPLIGSHAQTSCASCHQPESILSANIPSPTGESGSEPFAPRAFGRIGAVFGTPEDACATCHVDVHQGAFDQPGQPTQYQGEQGCARCHDQVQFRAAFTRPAAQAPLPFDHDLWTGFAIDGAHQAVGCFGCHGESSAGTLGGTFGTECSSCHTDVHLGQFASLGDTSCDRCHSSSAADFAADLFQHDTHSTFALDKSHQEVACASCHRPWPMGDGSRVIRYKPLGAECSDCHGLTGGGSDK